MELDLSRDVPPAAGVSGMGAASTDPKGEHES
jgi:hypothetical protein